MEFWGTEVKSGETIGVIPGHKMVMHLSQGCLGEPRRNKKESVCLYVTFGDQKLVIGTLSTEKCPQISFDLVFEKEFRLSHNWKNGSVYFTGYRAQTDNEVADSDSDHGEPLPLISARNEKSEIESGSSESGSSDDEIMHNAEVGHDKYDTSDEEDEEDESDEEDEEAPKKAAPSKKRPADSATKTPVPDKKAKFVTPQKTDGKKGGGHVATPYPSKQAGKTPANNEKPKQQSPKSGGAFQCKTCSRSFKSDVGLQSHTKDKHGAAK